MIIKTQPLDRFVAAWPKACIVRLAACLCLILTLSAGCSAGHDHDAHHHDEHEEAGKEDHAGIIVFTDEQAGGAVKVGSVSYGPQPGVITCSARIMGAQSQTRTVTPPWPAKWLLPTLPSQPARQ